jgi:predicted phage baseplate assembly protein
MAALAAIDANAVWARQVQTVSDELLGSSNGQIRQAYFMRRSPVLAGQVIEVRELKGARAEVELPILQRELVRQGLSEADLRTVTDRATGKVSEVWVRWQERPHLLFSGPEDRHCVIERSQGQVRFGDGRRGRIPATGVNNILARHYQAGGGVAGNVSAGAVKQMMSGVLAQGVSNPRPAGGGAEAETLPSVHRRGPQSIRHRKQAITTSDYEWLAREASPAVAVARALPVTHPDGRPMPGWVRLVILPQSSEARPLPSFELRQQVLAYLRLRCPASMGGQISIAGPDYLSVGVEAAIAPRSAAQAGPVLVAARQALLAFLHPLTGGPEGDGWPFGRDVFLSDVAAVLEAVPGVDYVPELHLLLEGTPQGEGVDVPPNRIVAAGDLRLSLVGAE